jgi:transaldolase/glucose-6-phosphate isomerase
MFRWEVATAAAGSILGENPFDQPDVQLAKTLANEAMKKAAAGKLKTGGRAVAAGGKGLDAAVAEWLESAVAGDYLGIHAYLPPRPETTAALAALQAALHARTKLAVTLGYGPRFLHSTGQLHKGGTDRCRFLQIVDQPAEDLAVPETSYTFGTLIGAQAEGDRQALEKRKRTVLRIQLGTKDAAGLAALRQAVEGARSK